jgi:hypothetical protein
MCMDGCAIFNMAQLFQICHCQGCRISDIKVFEELITRKEFTDER